MMYEYNKWGKFTLTFTVSYIKTKLQHDFDGPYPVFTKLIIN
uniref:Uncharacterized protein n=1 Tax=Bacillus subtilis subsp. natto TaxID=86029 RepID=E9RIY9_BACNA|nr:hypothetical protein [Bacillus subtilis subsp. natto]